MGEPRGGGGTTHLVGTKKCIDPERFFSTPGALAEKDTPPITRSPPPEKYRAT